MKHVLMDIHRYAATILQAKQQNSLRTTGTIDMRSQWKIGSRFASHPEQQELQVCTLFGVTYGR